MRILENVYEIIWVIVVTISVIALIIMFVGICGMGSYCFLHYALHAGTILSIVLIPILTIIVVVFVIAFVETEEPGP